MNTQNHFQIVGASPKLIEVLRRVEEVAVTDAPVLISGETGTGKNLLARTVHAASSRSQKPMVKIGCIGIAEDLLESRLLGTEMQSCAGGTLLLDGIDALSPRLQQKLASALKQGLFGSAGEEPSEQSVQLIATTRLKLEKAVQEGTFLEALYRQIGGVSIQVPPLRECKEDIPALADTFVRRHGAQMGKNIEVIPQRILDLFQAYHWPGNVRELDNLILRAVILTRGVELEMEDGFLKIGDR